MSCEEQQRDEFEALAAIYPSEFNSITAVGRENYPHFTVDIESEDSEEDAEIDKYKLVLSFKFPKDYPDVGPEIEILSSENLEDRDEIDILDELNDMIPENLGAAMIFTLVSRAFEWITQVKEQKKLERAQEEERKKQELEESERKKFEGTRVTVESFIAWKRKFDSEMQSSQKVVKVDDNRKLTGKEMFLTDKNLIDSDLNFPDLNNDGDDDDVKVDETLFLEDLDFVEE